MDSFLIIHVKKTAQTNKARDLTSVWPMGWMSAENLPWSTCLRSLILGFGECGDCEGDFQVYRGPQAYLFCLEVVCGLHSSMVGETEVFGQFKNSIKGHTFSNIYRSQQLKIILESICRDAKQVRQKYLSNLGSQSYGGMVRRLVKPRGEVHLVGAGQLVQSILPWVQKVAGKIHIHCQDPAKVRQQINGVFIHSLNESVPLRGGLIVAAPLSAQSLLKWMKNSSFTYTIDLRGESVKDPLPSFLKAKCLQNIFSEVGKE